MVIYYLFLVKMITNKDNQRSKKKFAFCYKKVDLFHSSTFAKSLLL